MLGFQALGYLALGQVPIVYLVDASESISPSDSESVVTAFGVSGSESVTLTNSQDTSAILYVGCFDFFSPPPTYHDGPVFGFGALGEIALGQLLSYITGTETTVEVATLTGNPVVVESASLQDIDAVWANFIAACVDGPAIPPTPYAVSSQFGFEALGAVALGQLDSIQYFFPAFDPLIVDYEEATGIYYVDVYEPSAVPGTVPSYFGFNVLGGNALGQLDSIQYVGSLIDIEDGGRGFYVGVFESLQRPFNASPMWSYAPLGQLALGQLGSQPTQTEFMDYETAIRIAGVPNADNLWINNVRFQQNRPARYPYSIN